MRVGSSLAYPGLPGSLGHAVSSLPLLSAKAGRGDGCLWPLAASKMLDCLSQLEDWEFPS